VVESCFPLKTWNTTLANRCALPDTKARGSLLYRRWAVNHYFGAALVGAMESSRSCLGSTGLGLLERRPAPRLFFGQAMTFRMLLSPQMSMMRRSRPSAKPPWGGVPNWNARSRWPNRVCCSSGEMPSSSNIRVWSCRRLINSVHCSSLRNFTSYFITCLLLVYNRFFLFFI